MMVAGRASGFFSRAVARMTLPAGRSPNQQRGSLHLHSRAETTSQEAGPALTPMTTTSSHPFLSRLCKRLPLTALALTTLVWAAPAAKGNKPAAKGNPPAADANKPANSATPVAKDPVLMQAMDAELHRAMAELGNAITPADKSSSKGLQQKPYFLSYSVADAENLTITAQYGAITASTTPSTTRPTTCQVLPR